MSITLLILTLYGTFANNDVYHHTHNSVQTNGFACFGDCINNVCAYDWWAHTDACLTSDVISPVYKTIKAKDCYSNCGKYNAEGFPWCATLEDNKIGWDRCSREEARTATKRIQTDNILYTCQDECTSRGESYNWCHTHNSWEYCDPENWVLVFDYPTQFYYHCDSRCVLYSDEYKCYDTRGKWANCYFNPDKSRILFEFNRSINNALQHYGNLTENGYQVCTDFNNKKKRAINSQWPFITSVTDLVLEFESGFPTITPNDGGPVQSYTVLPIPNAGDVETILPLAIRALITRNHLRPPGTRGSIPTVVTRNFNRQQPYRGRLDRNNDERGHLLASVLGGPMEPWNFFPQPRSFNRGQGSRWYYLEDLVTRFLRGRNGRYVDWQSALAYNVYSDRPNRPISVTLTVRMYEADGTLNATSGTFENMYFSNNPTWSCRTFYGSGK